MLTLIEILVGVAALVLLAPVVIAIGAIVYFAGVEVWRRSP